MENASAQPKQRPRKGAESKPLRMYLVPCSCGLSFAVTADYDRRGDLEPLSNVSTVRQASLSQEPAALG